MYVFKIKMKELFLTPLELVLRGMHFFRLQFSLKLRYLYFLNYMLTINKKRIKGYLYKIMFLRLNLYLVFSHKSITKKGVKICLVYLQLVPTSSILWNTWGITTDLLL